ENKYYTNLIKLVKFTQDMPLHKLKLNGYNELMYGYIYKCFIESVPLNFSLITEMNIYGLKQDFKEYFDNPIRNLIIKYDNKSANVNFKVECIKNNLYLQLSTLGLYLDT